ncbi:hypothetical protein J6590_101301, partial [Homalodisca vitripennis]
RLSREPSPMIVVTTRTRELYTLDILNGTLLEPAVSKDMRSNAIEDRTMYVC